MLPSRPLPRALVVLALVMACPRLLSATSIVLVWIDGRAVIAADSRTNRPGKEPVSTCKIRRAGSHFFVNSGASTTTIREPAVPRVIGVYETAREVCRQEMSPVECSLALHMRLETDLPVIALGHWKERPDEPGFLTYAFLGRVGDKIQVGARHYTKTVPAKPPGTRIAASEITVNALPFEATGGSRYYRMGSQQVPIENMPMIDIRLFAMNAVRSEIEANPDTVGLPVDLVGIDETGPRWLAGKPQCATDLGL